MFEGQVDSPKKINLLYDDVEQHCHVIVNIKGAMAKKYVRNACKKSCSSEATNLCEKTCIACIARPRALSPPSEFPAPSVIDILGAERVLRTTNRVPRIRNIFTSARDVARPVERSQETSSMTVASAIVRHVKKRAT